MHSERGLWSHANFRRLWLARTVSGFGSEITYLALPLLAASTLKATPAEMGLLTAAGTLPLLVLALWAGIFVDRVRRRPLLVMCDLGRALVLVMVALAAVAGFVRLEHVIVATFLGGALGLLAGIADNALLPRLLRREELNEGNAKLASSTGLTEGIGPGVASVLLQVVTAPVALLLDVVSFVASALLLGRIEVDEPGPVHPHGNVWHDLTSGLRFLWHQAPLRATVVIGALMQLGGGASDALRLLFITRTLGLPVTVLGAFFAVGAVSALVSSTVAPRITRSLGIGPAVSIGALAITSGWLAVYVVDGPPAVMIGLILLAGLVSSFGNTLFNISATTLQQSLTPQHMLGRVSAAEIVVTGGALPVGALVGGWVASWLGIRPTLLLAAVVNIPAIVAIIVAALWGVKQLPGSHASDEAS